MEPGWGWIWNLPGVRPPTPQLCSHLTLSKAGRGAEAGRREEHGRCTGGTAEGNLGGGRLGPALPSTPPRRFWPGAERSPIPAVREAGAR